MSFVSEEKSRLRKQFLAIRKNLSETYVQEQSRVIFDKLKRLGAFTKAEWIHCYVSISKNHEVSTHDFIRECIRLNKKVAVPKMSGSGTLKHFQITSFDQLKENEWGVPEPESGKEVSPEKFSLIVVPMVAGDRQRNRLGYGKGYYDRFLVQSNALKTGVLFNCQLHNDQLPVEPFDVDLDVLFTEYEKIS
ncbi:MAG: 5-formyltetrahydrofolate cyclo-ligase [Balneolaceae bacterium]|nr:5-formyltetrahydrofolate cyclo-ligase [Balneolaceae bacterium]